RGADVVRRSFFDGQNFDLGDELLIVRLVVALFSCIARGNDAGAAAEARYHEAAVFAERPLAGGDGGLDGLFTGVAFERVLVFDDFRSIWKLRQIEQFHVDTGENLQYLPLFLLIPRRDQERPAHSHLQLSCLFSITYEITVTGGLSTSRGARCFVCS